MQPHKHEHAPNENECLICDLIVRTILLDLQRWQDEDPLAVAEWETDGGAIAYHC